MPQAEYPTVQDADLHCGYRLGSFRRFTAFLGGFGTSGPGWQEMVTLAAAQAWAAGRLHPRAAS